MVGILFIHWLSNFLVTQEVHVHTLPRVCWHDHIQLCVRALLHGLKNTMDNNKGHSQAKTFANIQYALRDLHFFVSTLPCGFSNCCPRPSLDIQQIIRESVARASTGKFGAQDKRIHVLNPAHTACKGDHHKKHKPNGNCCF